MKTLLCALILATLGTTAAKADTITITFDQPNQTASAGGTLQFFGIITNDTNETVYLNSDDLNLKGRSLTPNDLFLSNVPFTLDPGANSGDIELFDVTVSSSLLDAPGTYSGTYNLVGGTEGDAQDNLSSANFSVKTTNPTPEPASIYLLFSGALATLVPVSRRVRKLASVKSMKQS